jgi:hypothetical protein
MSAESGTASPASDLAANVLELLRDILSDEPNWPAGSVSPPLEERLKLQRALVPPDGSDEGLAELSLWVASALQA